MSDPSIRLVQNPDGSPNIEVRGRLLHSKHNPLEEARRFLEAALSSHTSSETLVIIGFGAGYAARALFQLMPDWTSAPFFSGQVLFIENQPDLFAHALEFLPAEVKEHVRLLPDLASVSLYASGQVRLVSLPAHKALFPELHRPGIDASTRQRFFRVWSSNQMRRLARPMHYLLPDKQRDGAVVYCGASPSLFNDLARAAAPAVLAAADSSLAPLLNAGIVPDVVLSIDAGPGTAYHLAAARIAARSSGTAMESIPVLTWAGAHAALESYFKTLWFYRSTFPLEQILGHGPLAFAPEQINESRNTAGLAVVLASLLGMGRVELAGTGFVSAGTVTHVPGTGYDLYARCRQSRTTPAAGYRPRTYSPELSGKNRLSASGLEAMAKRMSIELVHLAGIPVKMEAPAERKRQEICPRVASLDESGRAFILQHSEEAARQFEAFGLSRRDIEKRLRTLKEA